MPSQLHIRSLPFCARRLLRQLLVICHYSYLYSKFIDLASGTVSNICRFDYNE